MQEEIQSDSQTEIPNVLKDDSTEPRQEGKGNDLEQKVQNVEVKRYEKFVTQTTQEQADQRKLNSYVLRGLTPQDIKDEDPKLVERLKKETEFSEIFKDEEGEEDLDSKIKKTVQETIGASEIDRQKREAIQSLTVDGKRLNTADIRLLNENPTFQKKFNALIAGGFDPYESARESLESAYPKFARKVSGSILTSKNEPHIEDSNDKRLSDEDKRWVNSWQNRHARLQVGK